MALNTLISAFFIQAYLVLYAFAAPIAQSTETDNAWEFGTTHGLVGLAVLILDIIVFGTLDWSLMRVAREKTNGC